MEGTLMKCFCQSGRLKALITNCKLPAILAPLYEKLDKFVKTRYRGALDTDNRSADHTSFEIETAKWNRSMSAADAELIGGAIAPGGSIRSIQDCDSFQLRGVTYEPVGEHDEGRNEWRKGRNSSILFRKAGRIRPGRITAIKSVGTKPPTPQSLYIIVEPYEILSEQDRKNDPYLRWPELDCCLVYNAFEAQKVVVRVEDIICHVARCPFKDHRQSCFSAELHHHYES